jgi:hypothetical protein
VTLVRLIQHFAEVFLCERQVVAPAQIAGAQQPTAEPLLDVVGGKTGY